jgi:hypothetical protein
MSTAAQVVARQVTRSGETLLLALEPLDDGEFFAENKNGYSAAWVTGHLACVADLFSSWFGNGLLFERPFHQVFNDTADAAPFLRLVDPVSKAASVDPALYPKTLLLARFQQAMRKALRILDAFGSELWDDPAPAGVPVTWRTGGDVWELLAVHTYWHCGELAGSMPRFSGTYTLNIAPHHLHVPAEVQP